MMLHYPPIEENPASVSCATRYDAPSIEPHMAAEVSYTEQNCASYTPKYRHRRNMQILAANEPLEFVAVDVVGLFSKMVQGSQYILSVTGR